MNQKQFLFGILSLLISAIGCSTSNNKENFSTQNFSKKTIKQNPLAFLYQNDTLTLKARFCECGEFGGHKEVIKVFNNYKNESFVRYIRDSINLDCPDNFDVNAIIIKDTMFKINKSKQKEILNYLNKLYKKSIKNYTLEHALEYFEASTKTNRLTLYTAETENKWREFRKIQVQLMK